MCVLSRLVTNILKSKLKIPFNIKHFDDVTHIFSQLYKKTSHQHLTHNTHTPIPLSEKIPRQTTCTRLISISRACLFIPREENKVHRREFALADRRTWARVYARPLHEHGFLLFSFTRRLFQLLYPSAGARRWIQRNGKVCVGKTWYECGVLRIFIGPEMVIKLYILQISKYCRWRNIHEHGHQKVWSLKIFEFIRTHIIVMYRVRKKIPLRARYTTIIRFLSWNTFLILKRDIINVRNVENYLFLIKTDSSSMAISFDNSH